MRNSTLILGPPGCGKTHTLMQIVRDALSRGIRPWEIGFLSFTRKAVNEAKDRASSEFGFQPKDMPYFKTLHALGFHLLALSKDDVMGPGDWKSFAGELGVNVKGDNIHGADSIAAMGLGVGDGDAYLRVIQRAGMRQVTLEQELRETGNHDLSWPMLRKMNELLQVYRNQLGKVTFTDMLQLFVDMGEAPRLQLLIVDEAQDLVPLQWEMVAKLAERAEEVYFAGDDDQAIHRWAGVDVNRFLNCTPNIRILEQSYRLPRSVFDLSQRVVRRIRQRIDKAYYPTEREGRVVFQPDHSTLDLSEGSWMLMARANYMAQEWGEQLREDGYMFSLNGQRSVRESLTGSLGTWQELRRGGSATAKDVKRMYQQMESGTLFRGAKTLLDAADPEQSYTIADLQRDFGLNAGDAADPLQVIKMNERERTYIRALERRGEDVTQEPRIKVGTIHSNKGGEDDNVAVDLGSTRAAMDSPYPDDEHRVFYVGLTRAKHNLHVIQSRKRNRYEL
jgi:superfamily I DNA/RNA helicase